MKIKHANLNKIMQRCTGKEIDFILYIAQFQDDKGLVKGINYKDLCNDINIAQSTFFHVISSLEDKEIIKINYLNTDYSFWTITINDNAFTEPSSFKEGYLNINYTILHSKQFQELRKGEKVIVLNLLKIANGRYKIKATIQTLMKWTGFKKQAVIRYIKRLSKLFNIDRVNNLCTFYADAPFYEKGDTEKNILNKHLIKYISKRQKANADKTSITEVSNLFNQYAWLDPTVIFEIIEKSLDQIGLLNVKYIHKYLSNYLKFTHLKP